MSTLQPLDLEPSLSALAQMRAGTDVEIPSLRLLFPLASYILWALIVVGWWSAGAGLQSSDFALLINGLGVLGLAASAGGSHVIFTLVNRCNEHSNRTRALFRTALQSLEPLAKRSGQTALLSLGSTEDGLYKLTRAERDRSAVLWALLALIPLVGWVFLVMALWRLSRDFAKHSQLEGLVLQDLDRTLRTVGLNGISSGAPPISQHDALGITIIVSALVEIFSAFLLGLAGALVLIYLTVGALSLFWIDLAIRDPIGHFGYHSKIEADTVRALPDVSTGAVG